MEVARAVGRSQSFAVRVRAFRLPLLIVAASWNHAFLAFNRQLLVADRQKDLGDRLDAGNSACQLSDQPTSRAWPPLDSSGAARPRCLSPLLYRYDYHPVLDVSLSRIVLYSCYGPLPMLSCRLSDVRQHVTLLPPVFPCPFATLNLI